MKLPEPLFLIINPMMRILLRSPLHGLMSASLMLITFKGRQSGRLFTTPVRYLRQANTIRCFTAMSNQWWRNIDDGADVVLRIAGHDYGCRAEAIRNDPERVRSALALLLKQFPADAPYYEISLNANGLPNITDLEKASHVTILVEAVLDNKHKSNPESSIV